MEELLQLDRKMFFETFRNDRSCIIWRFNLEGEKKMEPQLKITQT